MKRTFLVMLAISLLLVGCGETDEEYGYEFDSNLAETQDINAFFNEFFTKKMLMDPESATWMGEYDGYEANRQDDKLTYITFEFRQKEIDFYKNCLEVLLDFDEASLNDEERVNRNILVWYLNKEIEAEPFIHHGYLTNHFNGIAASLPSSLIRDHQINTGEDAENYILRLKAFPWKLAQLEDGIRKQTELGIIAPGFIFSAYSSSVAQFIAPQPSQNSLYTTFVTKLEACTEITQEEKTRLKEETLAAVKNYAYPAYKSLHEFILPYVRDFAKPSVSSGVWELPQGDEYYAYLVGKYTTTDLTPQEVHDLGLAEVDRIHVELRSKFDELGYQDQDTVALLQRIGNEDLIRDRDSILAEYRKVLEETQSILPKIFNTLPRGPVYIEPIPGHREASYTNHYTWPSRDGNRPGTFFVNLSYPHAKSDIKALLYHETLPGHHLQIALQIESDLPLFRDLTRTTAYPEGWALYAEKLMYENGYYGDSLSEVGYLKSELFRAARLVIDTGIHYKRWSRDEALDYLRDTTGLNWENEIDRYTVWPGQALAYKVGELKILELRELAREELGEAFDLKEFHDVILSTGSVPLEILEQEVIRYIEEKQ